MLDEALELGPQKGDRMPVAWGFVPFTIQISLIGNWV
jgi:hypothetical protein